MAGGPKGFIERAFRPHQNVRCRAHRAGNQHRLADVFISFGNFGPAGGEGARCALAVHQDAAVPAVHAMPFQLGDVVTNVVDQTQSLLLPEDALERFAGEVGDALAVGPGKISRGAHGSQICLPFGRSGRNAGKLAVRQVELVTAHGRVHVSQIVGTHLVSESARSGVDQHHNLVLVKAETLGNLRLKDALHVLHFQEVVAGTERAHLRQPALAGLVSHGCGIGTIDCSVLLAVLQVVRLTVTIPNHPSGALHHQALQIVVGELHGTFAARARRDIAEKLVDQLSNFRAHIVRGQLTGQQTHAAVDVKSHAARRHHAAFIGVGSRHAADRKAVALVNVRHSQRPAHDARQHRHVDRLLQREIFQQIFQQMLVGVDHRIGQHAGLCSARDQPAVTVELLELAPLKVQRQSSSGV